MFNKKVKAYKEFQKEAATGKEKVKVEKWSNIFCLCLKFGSKCKFSSHNDH